MAISATDVAADTLLAEIDAMLAQEQQTISLPWTQLNQAIGEFSAKQAKVVTQLQGKILKGIDQHLTAQDNALDFVSTEILNGLQNWQDQNRTLLEHLAAQTGMTQPGDPLETALVSQVSEVPELAYSATLLVAIRETLPILTRIAIAIEEVRDRLPGVPVRFKGEIPDNSPELPGIDASTFAVDTAGPEGD